MRRRRAFVVELRPKGEWKTLVEMRLSEGWTLDDQEAVQPAYLRLPMLLFRVFSEGEPGQYGELIATSCGELVDCDAAYVRVVPLEQVRPALLGEREPDWPSRSSRWHDRRLSIPLVAHGVELGHVELRRRDEFSLSERSLLRRFLDLAALGLYGTLARTELHRLAHEDPLTRLANRRGLERHLAETPIPHTLLLADLDGLKELNDQVGYDAGDELLLTVAQAILAWLPAEALAARLGGDEFVISIPCSEERGRELAEKLQRRIVRLELSDVLSQRFRGASVGVVAARPGELPAELLRRAGVEMRGQKRLRRRDRRATDR